MNNQSYKSGWLLILAPICLSAKNFGWDPSPLEILSGLLLVILFCYLILGGPYLGYFYIQSKYKLKKAIALLSLIALTGLSVVYIYNSWYNFFTRLNFVLNAITLLTLYLGYKQSLKNS